MLAKRCGVLLQKDITNTTPKVVYEHEIPVLNFKFGAKNVSRIKMERWVVIDSKQPPVHRGFNRWPIVEIDHDEEFTRLLSIYGKHETSGQVCVEMANGFIAVPGYKRRRNEKQVLELRFDGLAGCLRCFRHFVSPWPIGPASLDCDSGIEAQRVVVVKRPPPPPSHRVK